LITFAGGAGHFHPLVPIAQSVATPGQLSPSLPAAVESAGFVALATGEAREEVREQMPLLAPDLDREDRDLRERFARHGARVRAVTLLDIGAEWQPDVIVWAAGWRPTTRQQSDGDFWHPEQGRAGRDGEVADEDQFESTGQGVTIDRGDEGFRALVTHAFVSGYGRAVTDGERLEICPGAEHLAGAG
jgi:hypothetical protein